MTDADLPHQPVEPEPPQAVTAALPDGTPVTSGMTVTTGTQITLTTATLGAVIRYTLNDTCPCTEEALVYSGPITITGNTVLHAAALKDGVYSDTIRLELTVTTTEPEPESLFSKVPSVLRSISESKAGRSGEAGMTVRISRGIDR